MMDLCSIIITGSICFMFGIAGGWLSRKFSKEIEEEKNASKVHNGCACGKGNCCSDTANLSSLDWEKVD